MKSPIFAPGQWCPRFCGLMIFGTATSKQKNTTTFDFCLAAAYFFALNLGRAGRDCCSRYFIGRMTKPTASKHGRKQIIAHFYYTSINNNNDNNNNNDKQQRLWCCYESSRGSFDKCIKAWGGLRRLDQANRLVCLNRQL